MKQEKVLYVELPEGAEYQKVEVTENGRIGIIYTVSRTIPKPVPLIGGTDVYQKDNGTGYWYCKIKEGRDEFMHLYFADLTENDVFYDTNGNERKYITTRQRKLKANFLKALKNKPKEGFRWIPVYEPSSDGKGNVQYVSGEEVLIGRFNSYQWEDAFKNYSPENGSREAPITTHFLVELRWLKDGLVTIEQLADDSKEIGHYWDSENAKYGVEKTGERYFGGLFGFVGNTPKEVKNPDSWWSGFSLLDGGFNVNGGDYPLSNVHHSDEPHKPCVTIGLLELTK